MQDLTDGDIKRIGKEITILKGRIVSRDTARSRMTTTFN